MTLVTPADIKKPVPVIIEFGFKFPSSFKMNERMEKLIDSKSTWQLTVISKGRDSLF
jgi:hypothetical protein